MKKILLILIISSFTLLLLILSGNLLVVKSSSQQVYHSLDEIPPKNIGLVLGTSRYLQNGNRNMFFYNRIFAAVELYKKGKIKHILLSGDNRTIYYNEPRDMYNVLREMGIPKNAITLDYAGLRTLDSVVRCKEIFGQTSVTIITQQFHAYRAAYIANAHGLKANCYVADTPGNVNTKKVIYREYMARIKAIIDIYLLNAKPKFLGDKETIEIK